MGPRSKQVDCNWLVRIGVAVRAATAPAPLFCTQCHQYGHYEVNCHWLSRIGAAVRATTGPVPSNKRARRGTKGNKANKKAKSAAKNAAREGGKDLRKEAEAEASGGEAGPAPASPRAADPPLALSPPTLGPRAPTMLVSLDLSPSVSLPLCPSYQYNWPASTRARAEPPARSEPAHAGPPCPNNAGKP
ncbi:hypothetical protein N7465_011455 [Penicillium sp. CMV-2018d]|nr:hypothetical protein N7465_011455 [Penicillium sp. CMV-2018d]